MDNIKKVEEKDYLYYSLFNNMLSGVLVSKVISSSSGEPADYILLDVNPAFEIITGLKKTDIIGKSISDIFPPVEEFWIDLINKVATTGNSERFQRYSQIISKYLDVAVYVPAQGQIAMTFNDITEHKKLEEQLIQSQKMEAIGHLSGGLAHDFNNLLTGIIGYASLIKLESSNEPSIYECACIIDKAAERASQLTKQLLGFARGNKFLKSLVNIKDIIKEVISLLNRTIDKKISIVEKLGGDSIVYGDPSQIQQAILNLAINGRDAMPDGGELIIEVRTVNLDEDYCNFHIEAKAGHYALISISDTGSGIPKDIQEHIFEPFFTTKEKGKGSGMGLAMVYGIVKNHGGFIRFYSEVDYGTVFKIYLPIASEGKICEGSIYEEEPSKGKGKILLIDDEEIIQKVATKVLTTLGYEIVSFSSGKDAIEYYKTSWNEVDVVLIDMVMPVISGHDCFIELKEINPHIKAILSTGYSLDAKVREIVEKGMCGFIQKPYKIKELSSVISKIIQAEVRN